MHKQNIHPIPVPEAIELTKKWREFYAINNNIPDYNSLDVFRGFNITIETLRELLAVADRDTAINGIRVYLAKHTTAATNDDIHIILTPCHTDHTDSTMNYDILEVNGETAVMNFCAPCPPTCAQSSVLFSDANVPPVI